MREICQVTECANWRCDVGSWSCFSRYGSGYQGCTTLCDISDCCRLQQQLDLIDQCKAVGNLVSFLVSGESFIRQKAKEKFDELEVKDG